jgi:hypothetical protein
VTRRVDREHAGTLWPCGARCAGDRHFEFEVRGQPRGKVLMATRRARLAIEMEGDATASCANC